MSRTERSEPATSPGGITWAFRALAHRNYRLFFVGQLVSLVGTWMQSIAQAWLVYSITGSALLLGWVGFCGQVPVFLLAPLGGSLADRHDRRRIILGTQTASMLLAFLLAALTLTNRVTVPEVFALAITLGLVNAFDIPARQAFLVDMVGRDDLLNAIALNSSIVNGARIIGPAIAGILVARVGEGWCFLINGISFFAVLVGLLCMRIGRAPRTEQRGSRWEHIAEGMRYVYATRPIRALLLLLGLISLTGMPYATLMPVFASKVLHSDATGLGILMSASGIGALLGALSLAFRPHVRGLGRWVAVACSSFGVSLVLFSLSRSFWLSAALLVPAGCAMMIEMAGSNTLIQIMVPDRLRGRVMSVYSMMFMGMAPFGALASGTLAHAIGAPRTVALGGAVCLAGSFVFLGQLTSFRQEARDLVRAQQIAGGPVDRTDKGVPR